VTLIVVCLVLFGGLAALLESFGVFCSPHSSYEGGMRVLLDMDSLKVLAAKAFPEDMQCRFLVGSGDYPYFSTRGRQGKLANVSIQISPLVCVTVDRKMDGSYAVELFRDDNKTGVIFIMDLNLDGAWDVRKTRDENGLKNYIRIESTWVEVDRIDELLSGTPVAKKGSVQYRFDGSWRELAMSPLNK